MTYRSVAIHSPGVGDDCFTMLLTSTGFNCYSVKKIILICDTALLFEPRCQPRAEREITLLVNRISIFIGIQIIQKHKTKQQQKVSAGMKKQSVNEQRIRNQKRKLNKSWTRKNYLASTCMLKLFCG